MILLLLATRRDERSGTPPPRWWLSLARWTYQSCHSFLVHSTAAHPRGLLASNGRPQRIVKLGSCWGGWDCLNPSYLAPAHYRIFRDFMASHAALGCSRAALSCSAATPEQRRTLTLDWDALIETSYTVRRQAQCLAASHGPNHAPPSPPLAAESPFS